MKRIVLSWSRATNLTSNKIVTKYLFLLLVMLATCPGAFSQVGILEFANDRPIHIGTSEELVYVELVNSSTPLANPQFEVQLGTGITYIPGSVVTENGPTVTYVGTDLNNPIFEIPSFAGDDTTRFTFRRRASCEARDHKIGGGLYEMELTVTNNGAPLVLGGINVLPDDAVYATINIVDPTSVPSSVIEGDTALRTVELLNGNFGSIDTFFFADYVDTANAYIFQNFLIDRGGANIPVPASNIYISPNNDTVVIEFDQPLIQLISGLANNAVDNDNSNWFDQNESFELSYEMVPTFCGTVEAPISDLVSYWGDNGTICTVNGDGEFEDFRTATALGVTVQVPNIVFRNLTPTYQRAYCWGADEANHHTIELINTGTGDAVNFFWDIYQYAYPQLFGSRILRSNVHLDLSSFTITKKDGTPVLFEVPDSTVQSYRDQLEDPLNIHTNPYLPVSGCFDVSDTTVDIIKTFNVFILENFPAGDTFVVELDIYKCCPIDASCEPNGTSSATYNWEVNSFYRYNSECLNLQFNSGNAQLSSRNTVSWGELHEGPVVLFDDDSGTFTSTVSSYSLGALWAGGTTDPTHLEMVFTFPLGIWPDTSRYNPTTRFPNGRPKNFEWVSSDNADTLKAADMIINYPEVRVIYPNRQDTSGTILSNAPVFLGTNSFQLLKIYSDCDIPGAVGGNVSINKRIELVYDNPPPCRQSCPTVQIDCSNMNLLLYCPGPCLNPGINLYSTTVKRINLGGLDADNNGVWDDSLSIAPESSVFTNRAILGDTIGVFLESAVSTNAMYPSYDHGWARLSWDALSYYHTDTARLLTSVSVKRGGVIVNTCTDIPYSSISGNTVYINYGVCGPFVGGDTLLIQANFIIRQRGINDQEIVEAYTTGGNTGVFSTDTFGCVPIPGGYTLGNTFHTHGGSNTYSISGCSTVRPIFYDYFGVRSRYNNSNFFPFEYRPLAFPDSAVIDYPIQITPIYWQMRNIRSNGSGGITESDFLTPDAIYPKVGSEATHVSYYFDLKQHFNTFGGSSFYMSDEGWRFDVYPGLRVNCRANGGDYYPSGTTRNGWDFKNGETSLFGGEEGQLVDNETDGHFAAWQNNIRINRGNITVNASQEILTTACPLVETEFPTTEWCFSYRVIGYPVENTWVYVEAPNSGFNNFLVRDEATSTIYSPDANGYFQLGTTPVNIIREFTLIADMSVCNIDSVFLYAKYDCVGYPDVPFSELPCVPNQLTLKADPGVSRLSASIIDPMQASYDMCEPIDIEFDMISSLNASVHDLAFDFIIPTNAGQPGFRYVAGSGTIEYPQGTAPRSWDAAGEANFDAQFLAGNTTVTAQLAQLDATNFSGGGGLSKASLFPLNNAIVRFQVEPVCEFIAGQSFQMRLIGNDPCGDPAIGNGELVQGFDVDITNVSVPYISIIDVQVDNPINMCSDSVNYITFDILKLLPFLTTTSDVMEIIFPSFMDLAIDGSNPLICNTAFCPLASYTYTTLADGRRSMVLNWPAGMGANDVMVFSVPVTINDFDVSCTEENVIEIQTSAVDNVICDGVPCAGFSILTGGAQGEIEYQKGEFNFFNTSLDIDCTPSGDEVTIGYSFTNTGGYIQGNIPTVVSVYHDDDGNGALTTGDFVILQQSFSGPINNGDTISFSQTYTGINPLSTCPLLLEISSDPSCVCDPFYGTFDEVAYNNAGEDVATCPGVDVTLGCNAPLVGYTYTWSALDTAIIPIEALDDTTVLNAVLNYPNQTGADIVGRFVLTTSLGGDGCILTDTVAVTIYPEPEVTPSYNDPVCAEETIYLDANALQGATYFWTGPNGFTSTEEDPEIANASVADTGDYCVVMITAEGCVSSPACINVSITTPIDPVPTNSSPVCEGTDVQILAGAVGTPDSVIWDGPLNYSSTDLNPVLTNPTAARSGEYCLIAYYDGCPTNEVCTVITVISPDAPPIPTNSGPVCNGDSVQLFANALADTFIWNGPGGFSSDLQNPWVSPAIAGEYTLVLKSAGCESDTGSTTVVIYPVPSAPVATNNSALCEGEDLQLFASPTVSGATYTWSGPGGYSSTDQNPVVIGATIAAHAGDYTVVISINGCPSPSSAPTTVVIHPIPATPTPTDDSPQCEGEDIQLTANAAAGTDSVLWSGPDGYSSTTLNPLLSNVTLQDCW